MVYPLVGAVENFESYLNKSYSNRFDVSILMCKKLAAVWTVLILTTTKATRLLVVRRVSNWRRIRWAHLLDDFIQQQQIVTLDSGFEFVHDFLVEFNPIRSTVMHELAKQLPDVVGNLAGRLSLNWFGVVRTIQYHGALNHENNRHSEAQSLKILLNKPFFACCRGCETLQPERRAHE